MLAMSAARTEVGGDHQPAPAPDAIEPDAGRQREQQVRAAAPTAVSVPIWVASAPRVRTATSGSPSWVIWSPKTEIVWPSQRRRKSGASKRSRGM